MKLPDGPVLAGGGLGPLILFWIRRVWGSRSVEDGETGRSDDERGEQAEV